jgi:hypothetical protein
MSRWPLQLIRALWCIDQNHLVKKCKTRSHVKHGLLWLDCDSQIRTKLANLWEIFDCILKNGLFDLQSFRFKNESFWFHKLPPWCLLESGNKKQEWLTSCHAIVMPPQPWANTHVPIASSVWRKTEDVVLLVKEMGLLPKRDHLAESKQGWWIWLLPMTDCPRSSSSCILVNLCHKWARRKVSLEEQGHRVLVQELLAGVVACPSTGPRHWMAGSKYFRDLNTYHARKGTKCNIIGKFTCLMIFHPHFRCPDSDTSWNTQCFGDDCDVICLWEPFCSYDGTEK